jgi:hypothetical protein
MTGKLTPYESRADYHGLSLENCRECLVSRDRFQVKYTCEMEQLKYKRSFISLLDIDTDFREGFLRASFLLNA